MSDERKIRLLYVGLDHDVGFDSPDYYRLREQIEKLEGVRHCRELRSIGPNDRIHRLTFLAEVRQRIVDAYAKTDIQSARRVATRVIDEMAKELTPRRCGVCGTTDPERFAADDTDWCIQCRMKGVFPEMVR